MPKFADVHGLKGAIISAVDLVRGVGVLAGWNRIDVPGATGYLDTDYAAKGRYAIEALADHDIVCVHVEAPDEASHEGRADAKVEAHRADRPRHRRARPRRRCGTTTEWRILISPDHSTLLRPGPTTAHRSAWTMAGTGLPASGLTYDEIAAREEAGRFSNKGSGSWSGFLIWGGRDSADESQSASPT